MDYLTVTTFSCWRIVFIEIKILPVKFCTELLKIALNLFLSYEQACDERIFLDQINWFFLTSDTIDILCLVSPHFWIKKYLKVCNVLLLTLHVTFFVKKFEETKTKEYQSCPKSRKINAYMCIHNSDMCIYIYKHICIRMYIYVWDLRTMPP